MSLWDDVLYGVKNFTEGIKSGEVGHDLIGLGKYAVVSFCTDVLEIGVDEKINRDVAKHELANQIKANLKRGNYSTVNIGLTAEVSDIKRRSRNTEVDFEVQFDDNDEICEVKMSSRYGTDLEVGDRLKLTV
ncbi:MAG: hypothetical protein IJS14_11135 [Lentisphaeria bacterium]|nr:hypothetical protein [Lentisphaeria bacterium]